MRTECAFVCCCCRSKRTHSNSRSDYFRIGVTPIFSSVRPLIAAAKIPLQAWTKDARPFRFFLKSINTHFTVFKIFQSRVKRNPALLLFGLASFVHACNGILAAAMSGLTDEKIGVTPMRK